MGSSQSKSSVPIETKPSQDSGAVPAGYFGVRLTDDLVKSNPEIEQALRDAYQKGNERYG
jgi:hypothetical protein